MRRVIDYDKLNIRKGENIMIVYYDGQCDLCIRIVTLCQKLYSHKKISYISFHKLRNYPREMEEELHVKSNGKMYKGFHALIIIARAIPLFWLAVPLMYILKGVHLG